MNSDLQAIDTDVAISISDQNALDVEMGSSGTLADVTDVPESNLLTTYVVQAGDTVASIAVRFGVSANTIRWANDLKKNQALTVGQTLLISPVSGVVYRVKKGDTLPKIEKKFSLDTTEEISSFLDFNNLDESSALTVGDTIVIPGAEISESVALPSPSHGGGKTGSITNIAGAGNSLAGIIKDYFIKPIPCPMTQGRHDHYAVDLSCHTQGTPIHAAADGTVIFANYGWNGAYGNLVIIQHPNDTKTLYAHIKPNGILVKQGEEVTQGQVIAYVGTTGHSTGPHLHFEVRGAGQNPGFDYSGSSWKPWSNY
jgi:murein DD-endopeptidase MepM/ murein hydrolase activator NlpD